MSADDDAQITSFANHVLYDWDNAMTEFFRAVERKQEARGLTTEQVHRALDRGYGDEVADAWDEWMADS